MYYGSRESCFLLLVTGLGRTEYEEVGNQLSFGYRKTLRVLGCKR